jgi:hypothetical protein
LLGQAYHTSQLLANNSQSTLSKEKDFGERASIKNDCNGNSYFFSGKPYVLLYFSFLRR